MQQEVDLEKPTLVVENNDEQMLGGRYRLTRLIGAGAYGRVYEAEHVELGTAVALKVLHKQLLDSEQVRRFKLEAEILFKLDHPNICRVTDFVYTDDGQPVIVMEYLPWRTLSEELSATGPLSGAEALEFCEQICSALEKAHSVGVVHRDIKPGNVLLNRDEHGTLRVKLLDFGLAKLVGTEMSFSLTATGMAMGTASYMSPEQWQGTSVDGRADLYALGCVLYEVMTGKRSFDGDTYMEVMAAHLNRVPKRLSNFRLQYLFSKLTQRDAQYRYQNATEALAEIRRVKLDPNFVPPPAATKAKFSFKPFIAPLVFTAVCTAIIATQVNSFLSHRAPSPAIPPGTLGLIHESMDPAWITQLDKDYKDFLAQEPPSRRLRIEEAFAKLFRPVDFQSDSAMREFRTHLDEVRQLRPKCGVPNLIKLTHILRNAQSEQSTTDVLATLQSLTGQAYNDSSNKDYGILSPEERLAKWWQSHKATFSTQQTKMSNEELANILDLFMNESSNMDLQTGCEELTSKLPKALVYKTEFDYRDPRTLPVVDADLSPPMIPLILSRAEDFRQHAAAADLLARIRRQSQAKAIETIALSSPGSGWQPCDRFVCLMAMWKAGENIPAKPLLEIYEETRDPGLKAEVLYCLETANPDPAAKKLLAETIEHSDYEAERTFAYNGLRKYMTDDLIPKFKALNKDSGASDDEARAALATVANGGTRNATQRVVDYIQDLLKEETNGGDRQLSFALSAFDQSTAGHFREEEEFEQSKQSNEVQYSYPLDDRDRAQRAIKWWQKNKHKFR